MANTFDYQRALEQSNQPLNTLASGILANSQSNAARMFQVEQSKQRRQQDLQDQQHSESRQDEIRRQERRFRVSDRAEDRAYEEEKLAATQQFNLLVDLIRERRSDKRAEQADDRYFNRLDQSSRNAIKREIIREQGIAPNEGEDDETFIRRAAGEKISGFKTRAKSHVARQKKIDELSDEYSGLVKESQADLEKKVKKHAVDELTATYGKKYPDAVAKLQTLDPETVINQLASTQPAVANEWRAAYASAQESAQKALEGYVSKELKVKLDNVSRKARSLEYQQSLDQKSKDFNSIAPFISDELGVEALAPSVPGGGLQRVAPDKTSLDGFMGGFVGPTQSDNPQAASAPSASTGNRVEGLLPAIGRMAGEVAPDVSEFAGSQEQMGAGVRAIPSALFGGELPQGQTLGSSLRGIPAGAARMMLGPLPQHLSRIADAVGPAGINIPLQMADAASNVSDALTGAESYPAPSAANIADYREDIGRPPRRYMMGDMQARQGAEQQQQAQQIQRQLAERVYGGSPPPSPEEGQVIKRLAMQDGFTVQRMEEMVQRALRGDPVAIQTARQYLNRVRGPRSFSPF